MSFNSNQGYPQQPFSLHNPAPFTQRRAYGAMVGMRYGSFSRTTTAAVYNSAKFGSALDNAAFGASADPAVFSASANTADFGSAD